MKIGVRFCGGCRALYDRAGALADVKDSCPGFEFDYFAEGGTYDIILVINGCFSACADTSKMDEQTPRVLLGPYEADDIRKTVNALNEAAAEIRG